MITKIQPATKQDLPGILEIQKAAFLDEAKIYNNYKIRPLFMTLEDMESDFENYSYLKAIVENTIAGSVKYKVENSVGYIGNLIVDPVYQNRGIGKDLVTRALEEQVDAEKIELFTGYKSEKNISFYKKFGFKIIREDYLSENEPKMVFMELLLIH
jgi:ribosomal protein S18 acetylase RimI-like enzyme